MLKLLYICFLVDVPGHPKGPLQVTAVSHNYVDLEWKAPSDDGGQPITKYIIEYKSASRLTWNKAGEVDANTLEYRVMNLVEDTEYYFRVMAVNAEGESPPLETTDTTIPQREICKWLFLF